MARKWTPIEQMDKRKELVYLYSHKNQTISEVANSLGIAESTVYDRMVRLQIPTTPERKAGYLSKRNDVIFPRISNKFAEFIGIMLGDGHIGPGQIWVFVNNTTDKGYIPYVSDLLESLFGVRARISYVNNREMANLYIGSVDLIDYLRKKGLHASNKVREQVDVPLWVLSKNSYKKSFTRGFFDTDGSIYRLKFGVQMCFCNRSLPLLSSTREILLNLGYHPSRISTYNLYLTRKPDLRRYIQEIGFGNPKHSKRAMEFGVA
ncbi:MAG: LAGLIDADG family homing endonuclease [Patescibacteria group bacterium]|nr:LAGLIDADG family homing endonuclease [Patescibacteria group bacterium]